MSYEVYCALFKSSVPSNSNVNSSRSRLICSCLIDYITLYITCVKNYSGFLYIIKQICFVDPEKEKKKY